MAKRGKRRRNKQRREKRKKRPDNSVMGWRTSSATFWSTTCVEVARDADTMYVRDSLNPRGPMLSFDVAEWTAFLTTIRA